MDEPPTSRPDPSVEKTNVLPGASPCAATVPSVEPDPNATVCAAPMLATKKMAEPLMSMLHVPLHAKPKGWPTTRFVSAAVETSVEPAAGSAAVAAAVFALAVASCTAPNCVALIENVFGVMLALPTVAVENVQKDRHAFDVKELLNISVFGAGVILSPKPVPHT